METGVHVCVLPLWHCVCMWSGLGLKDGLLEANEWHCGCEGE